MKINIKQTINLVAAIGTIVWLGHDVYQHVKELREMDRQREKSFERILDNAAVINAAIAVREEHNGVPISKEEFDKLIDERIEFEKIAIRSK